MSMATWTLATLAQGAAITLTAQISAVENVGFECSAKGLSILARLETNSQPTSNARDLELVISEVRIKPKVVYMVETKPPFWSGDLDEPRKVLSLVAANDSMKIIIPNRLLEIDLDRQKTNEFKTECTRLLIENP
jgi:hypothetical protein